MWRTTENYGKDPCCAEKGNFHISSGGSRQHLQHCFSFALDRASNRADTEPGEQNAPASFSLVEIFIRNGGSGEQCVS